MNQTELRVLKEIAAKKKVREIAIILKKSGQQVYRAIKRLRDAGFLEKKWEIKKNPFTNLLLRQLQIYPNLIPVLADSGTIILTLLLQKNTIKEIEAETNLKKSIIYKKIKEARQISLLDKDNLINDQAWPELKKFLEEYRTYQKTVDERVPADAQIYHKNKQEIVYSTSHLQDTVKTAFSAFQDLGIKLFLPEEYYYLPKKKLSLKEVYLHTLYVVEERKTIYNLTYLAVFYLKYKNQLLKVKHPLINGIKQVLKGKIIKGYPTLKEIKEKAELYNIK